jgi:hypothetical protein
MTKIDSRRYFAQKLLGLLGLNSVYMFFLGMNSKSLAKNLGHIKTGNPVLAVGTIQEILSGQWSIPETNDSRIKPSGYYVPGDIEMWEYIVKANSSRNHNGGTVLQIPGFKGRLEALVDGRPIDPRKFGASENQSDCHSNCQKALDYCAEKGLVFEVPENELSLSYSLSVPAGAFVSFRGKGNKSILRFSNCHGIIFNNVDNIDMAATSLVSDFRIIGNNCGNFSAIYFPGNKKSIEVGARCPCYEITGLQIHFYGIGMYARFASRLRIYNNDFLGCYYGVVFLGQILQSSIIGNRAIRGHANDIKSCNFVAIQKQLATAYLISGINDFISGYRRPESIFLEKNLAFKYDIGIEWIDCLFGKIFSNDIDFPLKIGIRISNTDGGLSISNNWIALDENARYGIFYVEMATQLRGKSTVADNYISGYSSLDQNSVAIYINPNHAPINISQNYIEADKFWRGIYVSEIKSPHISSNIFGGDAKDKNISVISCAHPIILYNVMTDPSKVNFNLSTDITVSDHVERSK